MRGSTVYKHLDAEGVVLYVGCTLNITARTRQHLSTSSWRDGITRIEVDSFFPGIDASARAKAARREWQLISRLRPPHNRRWAHGPQSHFKPNTFKDTTSAGPGTPFSWEQRTESAGAA